MTEVSTVVYTGYSISSVENDRIVEEGERVAQREEEGGSLRVSESKSMRLSTPC